MMKLNNFGESFKMLFDGEEHTIPNGEFEVNDSFGYFIEYVARKWNKEVQILDNKKQSSTKHEVIKREKPAKKEETKNEEIQDSKSVKKEVKNETKPKTSQSK